MSYATIFTITFQPNFAKLSQNVTIYLIFRISTYDLP
jgi:hypothetical protein